MSSTRPTPTLVFLHFLGGSAGTWKPVEDRLEGRHPCLRLDLPGFGDANHHDGYAVADMADWVTAQVQSRQPGPWILAGHSMGAKVALLIARRAEDGDARLAGLCGLVLAAGSPASPEPMADAMRADMMSWFTGGEADNRRQADDYIGNNVASPLPAALHDDAVSDVLRASRTAWTAWLQSGSRENLVRRIGVLRTKALILAGRKDSALGGDAQRALMAPHFAHSNLEILDDAAHLLPIEQPGRVTALIEAFAASLADAHEPGHEPGPDPVPALLESDRITKRTRTALAGRLHDDPAYSPQVLGAPQLAILRAVMERVLPPPDGLSIDLAARLDAMLTEGTGDGWRFAGMPPDAQAYSMALDTLEASAQAGFDRPFVCLPQRDQEKLLDRIESSAIGFDLPGMLTAENMEHWFEELRGDAARLLMGDPRMMARLGCTAVATGGDAALAGFTAYGPNSAEDWEPALFGAPR
ncbi:alpha/beta hydrolase [Lichenicola sp.]|uniref:alpha/beta hydrolase n=1 Tax=Lichenicola sp. TaxID=2804529 RepID=UPI003B000D5C